MTTTPKEPVPDLGLICDVCKAEPARGVYSVPFMPVSCAYGDECLRADAHPYGMLVANTVVCGGLENTAPEWKVMVGNTLSHLDISWDKFNADVAEGITDMDSAFERGDL